MGLDTRLSLRTTAQALDQPTSLSEPVVGSGQTPSRSIFWHVLGIVFAAWAVLFWLDQTPHDRASGEAHLALSEAIVGKWSCRSEDANGQAGSTYMRFGPEGSFERRSGDVGSLVGDYATGSEWVDISLTRLPALEKYGMDPSINQKMRLNMADYSKRRLVFDSEITTNGLGSRRWTCGRS